MADPDRSIGGLSILSAAERSTILEQWNATGHAVSPSTLPELFAAQAARTPEAVAVVCADRTLSYAALEAHANRLAHHLRALGVGPETVVGLCVERSLEMVIGLLGILKAGGAYLPLDPHYPAERLAFMLADAAAAVLVTQGPLLARWPRPAPRCRRRWCGSTPTGRQIARAPQHAPALDRSPRTTRPTSSTPQAQQEHPKGVVVTHTGVRNFLAAQIEQVPLTPEPAAAVGLIGFDIAELAAHCLCARRSIVVLVRTRDECRMGAGADCASGATS